MNKPAPVPIVKGNSFRNFQCSKNKCEIDQMDVLYASAVGSLLNAYKQELTLTQFMYPGCFFWQKSSPDIDHWNGVENVLQLCKDL